MNKLERYILKRTIVFFLVSMLLVALILNLIDLFTNISNYLESKASFLSVLKVSALFIPKTIWYASPIAFLFSVTYILSEFYSTNQMEAIFASGISLYRFVRPIVIFSVLCSFLMLIWEDKVCVQTLKQKNKLQSELLGTTPSLNNSNVVVQSEGGQIIYKVDHYNHETKTIEDGCYFIFRDEQKNLQAIIYCENATWSDSQNKWILATPKEYILENNTLICKPAENIYLDKLTENYEIFKRANLDVSTETIKDSKIYINHLRKAGLPYYEPQSVYFKKYAFSFIFFVSGLLAIGLTGRTRKNVLLISLTLSVVSVVLYYVFQMCTMVLAKTQVITPFMGAWLSNIVFTIISCILIKYQRT